MEFTSWKGALRHKCPIFAPQNKKYVFENNSSMVFAIFMSFRLNHHGGNVFKWYSFGRCREVWFLSHLITPHSLLLDEPLLIKYLVFNCFEEKIETVGCCWKCLFSNQHFQRTIFSCAHCAFFLVGQITQSTQVENAMNNHTVQLFLEIGFIHLWIRFDRL